MNHVNLLQEEPSPSLTDQALELYLRSKAAIAEWEPRPMPPGWRPAARVWADSPSTSHAREHGHNRMESQ